MADGEAIVNGLMAAISNGDLDGIKELLDPELVSHGALGDVHGPDGFVEVMISNIRTAYPDVQVQAVGVIQDGDMISWRIEGSATHTGPFLGLAPTGKRIRIKGIHQARNRNGRLVEHWQGPDILAMLVDMGRVPFS
ncbi:MAG: ester cyclase [Candidatus Nanopelagicales bacterium]|nr:ester cyclase [Candidatus Nanopelagicales bacterium]